MVAALEKSCLPSLSTFSILTQYKDTLLGQDINLKNIVFWDVTSCDSFKNDVS
jgi:hypothetical protein